MTLRALLCATVLVTLALPAPADAVLPGVNGRIVLTSGRDDPPAAFTDTNSQIWVVDQPGGAPVRVTNNAAVQHRHSTWSPDGTKIAYAAGAAGDWDILVQDLTQPLSATNPTNLTQTPGVPEDRPAWSPDGTRIAYGRTSGGVFNIFVQSATGGLATPVTTGILNAEKPAWTPDSTTIYYQLNVDAQSLHDIYKTAASGVGVPTPVVTGTNDDYQPALSPDGQNLCFTEGPFFSNNASVQRSTVTGAAQATVASSGYNCVWSPDATKIAYVQGALSTGALVMRNSDGTGPIDFVVNDVAGRFDGNPDWARAALTGAPSGNGATGGGGGNGGRGPGVTGSGGNGGDAGPCGGGGGAGGAVGSGGGGAGGGGCFDVAGNQRLAAGAVLASAGVTTGGTTVRADASVDMGPARRAYSSRTQRIGTTIMRGLGVGRYKVVVRLTAKGKRRLKQMRRPKVTLRLAMTEPVGRPLVVTRVVTLRR